MALCPHCRNTLPDTALHHCPNCGGDIVPKDALPPPVPPEPAAPAPPPPVPPAAGDGTAPGGGGGGGYGASPPRGIPWGFCAQAAAFCLRCCHHRAGGAHIQGQEPVIMKIAYRKATTLVALTADLYREMAASALRLLPGRSQA